MHELTSSNGQSIQALPPLAYLEDRLSTHSKHILPTLAKRFRIVLITTDTSIPPAPYDDVIQLPSKRYELQCGFQFARVAERLFRAKRISFAYTYNCSGFALRRVPYLHVFGGSFLKNFIEYNRITPWARRAAWIPGFFHYVVPEAITAWRSKIIVAKVQELKADLIKNYRLADQDIVVINNGISREYLDLYETKDFDSPPKILFTGRLHIDKGILPLVEALARHPEIQASFMIVGDGPQRGALERLAARDPRIQLLGWRTAQEIRTILSESQIFLFPGIVGGYSCSLLEGMASGHACICYDLPGNREAVQDAGFFEPVGDPDAIWRRCAELSSNRTLLRHFALRAHQRAKTLTWDAFADNLTDVFLKMYRRLGVPGAAELSVTGTER